MASECNVSYDHPDPLEPRICKEQEWMLTVEAVFLALVVVCSIGANSFVLFLVAKYKALRYMSMIVSVCGVIVDLLMTLVFHIPALVSVSNGEWAFHYVGCQVIGSIIYYLVLVRWMIMAVIALDRLSYVLFPLSYNSWSKPYLITLLVSAWCVPIFMNIPSVVQVGTYSYRTGLSNCALECDDDMICKLIHFLTFLMMYSMGVLIPTCVYTAIAIIARTKKRRVRMGMQLVDFGENGTNSLTRSMDINWTTSDTKGRMLLVVTFVCFIITNTPLYIIVLLRRTTSETYLAIPLWAHMIFANLFYLSNVLNPLLILRNKDFTKAAFKLLCERKPIAYRSSSLSTLRRASIAQH